MRRHGTCHSLIDSFKTFVRWWWCRTWTSRCGLNVPSWGQLNWRTVAVLGRHCMHVYLFCYFSQFMSWIANLFLSWTICTLQKISFFLVFLPVRKAGMFYIDQSIFIVFFKAVGGFSKMQFFFVRFILCFFWKSTPPPPLSTSGYLSCVIYNLQNRYTWNEG